MSAPTWASWSRANLRTHVGELVARYVRVQVGTWLLTAEGFRRDLTSTELRAFAA